MTLFVIERQWAIKKRLIKKPGLVCEYIFWVIAVQKLMKLINPFETKVIHYTCALFASIFKGDGVPVLKHENQPSLDRESEPKTTFSPQYETADGNVLSSTLTNALK